MKKIVVLLALVLIAYLTLWPVPVDPEAWRAPDTLGYVGRFQQNNRLGQARQHRLNRHKGPEDVVWDGHEHLYTGTDAGVILRIHLPSGKEEAWADTGGRPLGMEFAPDGNLIVADALLGLVSVSPTGEVTVLTNSAAGIPIVYADDVAVDSEGKIYLTDATTKFSAADSASALEASLSDILEHRPNGRIIVYDPTTKSTEVLLSGLYFPNGIVLANHETELLFVETSQYRIMKFPLNSSPGAKPRPILENLPGFPDNINAGKDGYFWVGLVAPRDSFLDTFSSWPSIRKVVKRIPAFLRPKPREYGHVFAIDSEGTVVKSFQDLSGEISFTTGAIETSSQIWISSLRGEALVALPREAR